MIGWRWSSKTGIGIGGARWRPAKFRFDLVKAKGQWLRPPSGDVQYWGIGLRSARNTGTPGRGRNQNDLGGHVVGLGALHGHSQWERYAGPATVIASAGWDWNTPGKKFEEERFEREMKIALETSSVRMWLFNYIHQIPISHSDPNLGQGVRRVTRSSQASMTTDGAPSQPGVASTPRMRGEGASVHPLWDWGWPWSRLQLRRSASDLGWSRGVGGAGVSEDWTAWDRHAGWSAAGSTSTRFGGGEAAVSGAHFGPPSRHLPTWWWCWENSTLEEPGGDKILIGCQWPWRWLRLLEPLFSWTPYLRSLI